MRFLNLLTAAAMAQVASAALGFAVYSEIRSDPKSSGHNNEAEINFDELPLSANTVFMYIQIVEGYSQDGVIQDFMKFAKLQGPRGYKVIPRVRYGKRNGDISAEPKDWDTVMADVKRWTQVFKDAQEYIDIPVIQAGFLGLWGEWHGTHFADKHGNKETAANQARKKELIAQLRQAGEKYGTKIALRYPMDHGELGYTKDKQITMHNDCMMDSGPDGADRGTFREGEIAKWRKYVKDNISGNFYGGEPCGSSDDTGTPDGKPYNWSDTATVCSGPDSLVQYIEDYEIAYLNPGNPPELNKLFWDCEEKRNDCKCIKAIQTALEKNV